MTRLVAILLISAAASPIAAQESGIDELTGFPKVGDWELVRANCIACHSAKLITQQRGTETQWRSIIRWMQDKQNLWEFEPQVEDRIVTWLAANYPPSENRRRAAIPPDLLPPNPYGPATDQDVTGEQSMEKEDGQ